MSNLRGYDLVKEDAHKRNGLDKSFDSSSPLRNREGVMELGG
jgi:hypothetical protein